MEQNAHDNPAQDAAPVSHGGGESLWGGWLPLAVAEADEARLAKIESAFQAWWTSPSARSGRPPCLELDERSARAAWAGANGFEGDRASLSPKDMLRITNPSFAAHLERCSADVATWPAWKKPAELSSSAEQDVRASVQDKEQVVGFDLKPVFQAQLDADGGNWKDIGEREVPGFKRAFYKVRALYQPELIRRSAADVKGLYKPRSTLVDALQWNGARLRETPPDWFRDALYLTPGVPGFLMRWGDTLRLTTDTGDVIIYPGEWIVRSASGKLYAMTSEAFAALYEPLVPADSPEEPKTSAPRYPDTIYYMRDDHIFCPLPLNVEEALRAVERELDDGFTSGSLFTKRAGSGPGLSFDHQKPREEMMSVARSWLANEIAARAGSTDGADVSPGAGT